MCWASLTTSQPTYSCCFPRYLHVFEKSDVDCSHIAFSKKKKDICSSDQKNGERIRGREQVNKSQKSQQNAFSKIIFRFLKTRCNILVQKNATY